jgi:hypothetical protein
VYPGFLSDQCSTFVEAVGSGFTPHELAKSILGILKSPKSG